ncbi:MAG TPA: DUF309 domain-containing protein, partial [Hyphomicrobiales bacterium]|nr:DUF309 domain-containing protein [Hyphomicrobiales bacterium]
MPDKAHDPRVRPWPQPAGIPRYSRLPLPPYRFIPKLAPHPTREPEGHSHARENEPDTGEAGFRHGVDLHNRGCWWEAHEAWEAVWLAAERGSARRAAIQGLIQVANAHLKLEQSRARAVRRLQGKYDALFAAAADLPSGALGFDLPAWRRAVDAYFEA